jgi:cyanophycinase
MKLLLLIFTLGICLNNIKYTPNDQFIQSPPVKSMKIILAGGGNLPDTIWKRFIHMSGGESARILIIPTARYTDSLYNVIFKNEVQTLKRLGIKAVKLLHAPNPSIANSDSFVKRLENCDGVWIAGGYTCLLAESYTNTIFNKALKHWVFNGGVLGGSSAGASIIGEIMPRTIGCRQTMNRNSYTGFKIIPKSIIEQHLNTRARESNIISMQKKLPDHLGIGVDEATALVINDSVWEVIGNSKIIMYWPHLFEMGEMQKKIDTTHFYSGRSFILNTSNDTMWRKGKSISLTFP